MHSSIISKIEKARRYAGEPERVTFSDFTLNFHGEHDDYELSYKDNQWHCSCNFFAGWRFCSHTITLQRILSSMLPREALRSAAQYGLNPPPISSQLLFDIDKTTANPQMP